MSLASLHYYSSILGKQTTAQVILPEVGEPPFSTFYLLHGWSDDSTMWLRRTRVEWLVRNLPLVVVMPDGYKSGYAKAETGPDFTAHIGVELPSFIEKHFHVRPERSARAIGGLSMGGYGALRIGLTYPDRFCSANSFSGAVGWGNWTADGPESPLMRKRYEEIGPELELIFGKSPRGTNHDLVHLGARLARAGATLPEILIDCGTEDFLVEDNRHFHAAWTAAGVPHLYREFPGAHDWDYWEIRLPDALDFHAKSLKLIP